MKRTVACLIQWRPLRGPSPVSVVGCSTLRRAVVPDVNARYPILSDLVDCRQGMNRCCLWGNARSLRPTEAPTLYTRFHGRKSARRSENVGRSDT